MKIKNVEPIYTGGNMYIFLGSIDDNKHFIASDSDYDVRIINTDPLKADYEDVCDYNWQEEHLIEDLSPSEALNFFEDMLKHIIKYQPEGNYSVGELEVTLTEVKDLKKMENWK